jgi:uncharacterized membrane protein
VQLKTRLQIFHGLTLTGYLGIMVLLVVWYGWLAPPGVLPANLVIIALALPLFAPLRGLLHARPYTVAWSLYISLIYFIHGTVEAWSNETARWLALLEVSLALLWMIAGTAFIRTSKKLATTQAG